MAGPEIHSGGSRNPRRGRGPVRGRGPATRHFSVKMYAKTKEFGALGGVHRARPPRSANVTEHYSCGH